MRTGDREYLWVGKAAEKLGLHPITIRRWMKMGKIQAVRVGIEARIPRSEIARLLGQTVRCSCSPLLAPASAAGRTRLQQLHTLVREDPVAEVSVTEGDRITRCGPEALETLFISFGVTLTILNCGREKTPEQELTEDLLSISAAFAGKLYGMRSPKQKELLACVESVLHNP